MRLQDKQGLGFFQSLAFSQGKKKIIMGSELHCETKFVPFAPSPVLCAPSQERQETLA